MSFVPADYWPPGPPTAGPAADQVARDAAAAAQSTANAAVSTGPELAALLPDPTAAAQVAADLGIVDFVASYGFATDGSDNSPRLLAALNSGARNFLARPGKYTFSTPVTGVTSKGFFIEGVGRGKTGFWQTALPDTVRPVIFEFTSAAAAAWFLSLAYPSSGGTVGPFGFARICFRAAAGGSLIQIGQPDYGQPGTEWTNVNSNAMASTAGVLFDDCGFIGVTKTPNAETYPWTNQKLVEASKVFELEFRSCSWAGGDIQVRTHGCDRPIISGRFGYGMVPVWMTGAGIKTCHVVQDYQAEWWGPCSILADGVDYQVDLVRSEWNVSGLPAAGTRQLLTGVTASFSAGGTSIVFSASVTNKIIPKCTLFEVNDGAGTVQQLILDSLSTDGLTGTLMGSPMFSLPIANAASTVTRIGAVGLIHRGVGEGQVDQWHGAAGAGCPVFVYEPNRGALSIGSATRGKGLSDPAPSVIIANKSMAESNYGEAGIFPGRVSPLLMPDPAHPLCCSEDGNRYGAPVFESTTRPKVVQGLANRLLNRSWEFSPKTYGTTNVNITPAFQRFAWSAQSTGGIYGWLLADQAYLALFDQTLPEAFLAGRTTLTLSVLAKAASGSAGTLQWQAYSSGLGGSSLANVSALLGTSWGVYPLSIGLPAKWSGAGRGTVGVRLFNATGGGISLHVAAVQLVES